MDFLQELLDNNPQTVRELDLEFKEINNLSLLLPILSQFGNLRELSLHGNRLQTLPENLKVLKSLECLDISNNLIQNTDSVLKVLKTLPNLKILNITSSGKEDDERILRVLPNLELLNGANVASQDKRIKKARDSEYQTNYDHERSRSSKEIDNSKNRGESEFSGRSQHESPENYMDKNEKEGVTLKQEDLESVAIIYDFIREINRETNPSGDVDKNLAEAFDEHVKNVMNDLSIKLKPNLSDYVVNTHIIKAKYTLYEICFEKIIGFLSSYDSRLSNIVMGLHDAHSNIFRELSSQVFAMEEKLEENINNENVSSFRKTEQIIEAAEHIEKENQRLISERDEFLREIENLKEENSNYLNMIIKHSKGEKVNIPENLETQNSQKVSVQLGQHLKASVGGTNNNALMHANIGQVNVRILTSKQLKEAIDEIFASKQKCDQKYLEAKLPRETLEQHMYTYLNQKYGLKNIIIEWATAIINGVRKFAKEDNDILLFGKILKNECDEEFRFVQAQVKNTISELLKMYLRGKFPFKHNSEIKEMLAAKINGAIYEEECVDIIKYMYNQEDPELTLEKMKKLNAANFKPQNSADKERAKYDFSLFQKVILDFQLKSHERYLSQFLKKFYDVDVDRNGILNRDEFIRLLGLMDIEFDDTYTKRLFNIVDPAGHQQITFSQCVTLFSSELISDGENKLSILQKLSLE